MAQSGNNRFTVNLASGCVAGAVASTLTSPLDVVKTRLQSYSSVGACSNSVPGGTPAGLTARPPAVALPMPSVVLRRPIILLRSILQREGFSALYKGLSLTLAGIIPSRAIYFGVYGELKKALNSTIQPDTWKVHLGSALGAGVIVSTSTSPIWVVKTRIQVHQGSGQSRQTFRGCIRELYADNGIRSFYRGLTASYAGVCETAFYFVMYEDMKKRMMALNNDDGYLTAPQLVLSSVSAKSVAAVMAYPHEVVRTRLRVEIGKNRKYRSFFQTIMRVWREERFAGLYGGLFPHLCRVVPNTAIMFLVYEKVVRFLEAD